MSLPAMQPQKHALELLTEHYLIQCSVEPVGLLMTWLDSPDRANFQIRDATLTGLGADSAVHAIKFQELFIMRNEVTAIRVDEADLQGAVPTLRASERVRIFIPRFVVQGTLTHGEDTRLGDMFEIMKGTWAALHNAQVFPLTAIQAQVFREAPLLLVNKNRIRFYESVSS